uniref:Gfo/Idh/MocA-like oxidoreductase N-terminal domain-containing protein n=1 Tax=Lotharella oceanica TaxID=641309 RepID=A0A7S2TMI0_9EUKA|mmetsp:Transcript_21094/g.39592  ORF Transcript_21094/g.39592 Transcript_21094/m.39592 type:complete len:255 (+) Transcript_21094:356-1120(+)|eukprot:CAMPEP_0170183402 /NCGR_PEP_ID=MMETSP0040_2-20121228/30578_1 /TAXON_ID=641309 /ORGANISM="Lotharella oceanica, Strain CCMP622" /LENGTH=254 /DNA_ID=CAMNT_0010429121 /DNA_START=234 /DNA_END=998 /DNA_ORIENTATION=-
METHHDFAKMAMEAKKPVLVEKPVASSAGELESLKACSEEHNVAIMPGHNYIYEPWFDRTKSIIDDGDLGTIVATYVMFNIHHPPEFTGRDSMQGVIRQILTHHAYMSIYLMGGPPACVSAFASCLDNGPVEKENVAMVNMQMPNGALAHLQANFAADDHGSDPWSVYVKVIGTKGTARYSYNDWVINKPHIIHSHTYVPYPHTIASEVRFFVEEVVGKGARPLSTIDDALACQNILDAVEKSIADGTHVPLVT